MTKTCKVCGIEKDITQFAKNSRKKDGLSVRCKECSNAYYNKKKESYEYIQTRVCRVCGIEKDRSDYQSRLSDKYGIATQCKQCMRNSRKPTKYNPNYYRENIEKFRAYTKSDKARECSNKHSKKKRDLLNAKMLEYLKTCSCAQCGENNPVVLEFHHVDPNTKKHTIAAMLSAKLSWAVILDEISKCIILCANCHRIVTANSNGWYRSSSV